jgi:hypothetical protein
MQKESCLLYRRGRSCRWYSEVEFRGRYAVVGLYYTFLAFAVLVALVTLSLCRWRIRRFLFAWAWVSIALAILGASIPWRSTSGSLTGQGAPIPFEVIEHYADGGSADFPWPAALVLSPLAVFLGGLLLGLTTSALRRCSSRPAAIQGQDP